MKRRSPQAVSLIKTEIQIGRTFARIGLQAADTEKVARNAANATKAYETACAFAEKTFLDAADSKEIADGLRQLQAEVAKLKVRRRTSLKFEITT